MSAMVVLKAVSIWMLILVLAVLNGGLREAVLIPRLGATLGLVLSGVLLTGAILVITWMLLPWLGVRGSWPLLATGLGWLTLTLVFEFSFGLARGKPLTEILHAYTFADGNLWPLVLVVTALAPWLLGRHRC